MALEVSRRDGLWKDVQQPGLLLGRSLLSFPSCPPAVRFFPAWPCRSSRGCLYPTADHGFDRILFSLHTVSFAYLKSARIAACFSPGSQPPCSTGEQTAASPGALLIFSSRHESTAKAVWPAWLPALFPTYSPADVSRFDFGLSRERPVDVG